MVIIVHNKSQVFTPKIYVNNMLDLIGYKGKKIIGKYILENSCGEGNVLLEITNRYINSARSLNYSDSRIKSDIEKYIIGFEIDKRVIEICINRLNELANKKGIHNVNWNIKNEDYLKHRHRHKMDYIVGNPPYITYQELSIKDRCFLKETFFSCSKGKFDYCYAFIEKSISELSEIGKLCFIIPNSIFKNVFGEELRKIMINYIEKIYDFKESLIFGNNILTSPAIILINKQIKTNTLVYKDIDNSETLKINKGDLKKKWFFSTNVLENAHSSKKFGDYYKVSNSVATLLNDIFVIRKDDIINENDLYVEVKDGFKIEKEVLRLAASPRSYSIAREEYILFPYFYENNNLMKYREIEFRLKYPETYKYLYSNIDKLNNRRSDNSAKWFEFGRSQALSFMNREKLLISSVITNEVRTYRLDENTIPYSGFYIIPTGEKNLDEAEKLLKSEEFFSYLLIRGINANGKSLRFSVNDISNYPIK